MLFKVAFGINALNHLTRWRAKWRPLNVLHREPCNFLPIPTLPPVYMYVNTLIAGLCVRFLLWGFSHMSWIYTSVVKGYAVGIAVAYTVADMGWREVLHGVKLFGIFSRCMPLSTGCLVWNFPALSLPLSMIFLWSRTIHHQSPLTVTRSFLFLLLGILSVCGWVIVTNCDHSLGGSLFSRDWVFLWDSLCAGIYTGMHVNAVSLYTECVRMYCMITSDLLGELDWLVCAQFQAICTFCGSACLV